jgi:DNA-binding response OmpR family regulator
MCDESIVIIVDAAARGAGMRETVERLRARHDVPIIVMSAPVDADDIAARLEAVLSNWRRDSSRPSHLDVGEIRITPASRLVRIAGDAVDLTTIEYEILEYLARDAGHVVSRDHLMGAVCRREASPLDRSLDVHISHLRRKLKGYGSQILTVRGVGYMLAAEHKHAISVTDP